MNRGMALYAESTMNMFYETDSRRSMIREPAMALTLPTASEIDLVRKFDGDRFLKIGDDKSEALDQTLRDTAT